MAAPRPRATEKAALNGRGFTLAQRTHPLVKARR
jgi:hypothetical protein